MKRSHSPFFGPVKFGSAAARAPGADRHGVSAGVLLEPGNQVAALVEQSGDDFATGVIGGGDQEHRLGQPQGREQEQQFVEQRPAVAVGEHQTLVNPGGQRHGLKARAHLDQQSERLARMAHDILRLRVGIRSLMEGFDGRHLAARLRLFQPIGQQHEATVNPLHAGMGRQDDPPPRPRQGVHTESGAVEEIQQAAIAGRLEPEGPHEAGDPAEVPADRPGGECHRQPQKSALARARRPHLRDD